jgi:selenocysteine lyase/cysteine desulfurase
MSLKSRFAPQFNPRIRDRGLAYFRGGAVRFIDHSDFHVPVSIVGLEQLLAWGVRNIAATLAIRTAAIAARAVALGLSTSPPSLRAGHFLGLRFPEGLPDGLPERLAREQVHVSLRGDSLRVTPHLYNHDDDVDRLFAVLSALA